MARSDFAAQSGGGYDINDIITSSQDEHGHSVNLRLTVPKSWNAILHKIKESDSWPEYTSANAIMRDALYHRLHWISEQKNRQAFPAIDEAIAIAQAESSLELDNRRAERVAVLRKKIDDVLGEMLSNYEYEALVEWVDDFAEHQLPRIQQPHRKKLEEQLSMYRRRAELRW